MWLEAEAAMKSSWNILEKNNGVCSSSFNWKYLKKKIETVLTDYVKKMKRLFLNVGKQLINISEIRLNGGLGL